MPVQPCARHCERGFAVQRFPLRLLLQGLPSVRAFPGAAGRTRPRWRDGHLPDAPRALETDQGMDAVTCQRLSDNVLRWYTDYCQTPIGNTAATPRFPVVAVVHSFMVHRADGRSREEVLGSPLCRIFERPAVGPAAGERARTAIVRVLFRRTAKIFGSVWGLSTTIARAPELCRIQLGRNRCADGEVARRQRFANEINRNILVCWSSGNSHYLR